MKVGRSIVGSLAIAAVAFVCGLVASEVTGIGQKNCVVKVHNASNVPLRLVEVEVSTCGGRFVTSTQAVPAGSAVDIRYTICGEAGREIRATLQNGRVLTGSEQYVESGARDAVAVYDDRVVASVHAL